MSDLAEYARNLHEKETKKYNREIYPVDYPSNAEKVTDIRAVICDVYGTLLNYWKPGFESPEARSKSLLNSFKEVAERFGMVPILSKISPNDAPEKTLSDFYNGTIALNHEKAVKSGVNFPEVKIEDVWSLLLMILKRNGYNASQYFQVDEPEIPRYIAFTYNFLSLGRQLYPGVVETIEELKRNNIVIGILSNAQFYTPVDLTLMLRDQSGGRYDDYLELFDIDLTFYSYEYGVSKPNQLLFRRLYDALYEYHILPSQTIFIGNDLSVDIQPAQEAGMRTAFFAGDRETAFFHDLDGQVIPDITFKHWSELSSKISFYEEKENREY